jgi:hypothetical protein
MKKRIITQLEAFCMAKATFTQEMAREIHMEKHKVSKNIIKWTQ